MTETKTENSQEEVNGLKFVVEMTADIVASTLTEHNDVMTLDTMIHALSRKESEFTRDVIIRTVSEAKGREIYGGILESGKMVFTLESDQAQVCDVLEDVDDLSDEMKGLDDVDLDQY